MNADFSGAARTPFGGDGFDDEAAGLFRIERDFGAVKRGIHEGDNFRIVESGGVFQPDMASEVATTQEAAVRIGDAGALKKAEADMIGIEGN